MAKNGRIGYNPDYDDSYTILPIIITANANMHTTRHCVPPDPLGNVIFDSFNGSFSHTFEHDPPPNLVSSDMSIPEWIGNSASRFLGEVLRFSVKVRSQQADDRPAWLGIDAYAIVPGAEDKIGKIFFTQDEGLEEHFGARVSGVDWRMSRLIEIKKPFSIEDISLNYSGSAIYHADHCGLRRPPYTPKSDTVWDFRYHLVVSAKKNVDAVLKSADGDSATWLPAPDDVRTFTLTLEEPSSDEVEEVRFTLTDVSSYPGIALNAGNHILTNQCSDCTVLRRPEVYFRHTNFAHEDNSDYPIRRAYAHYNACPIDDLPDMFFSERENKGFDLTDGGTRENLQYMISKVALLPSVESSDIQVKVTVKDGAASGKLKAEVKVGGVWYPARTEGPCADDDGEYLILPLDKNDNGLGDSWERAWAVNDPHADNDSLPMNPNKGDGLTVFEEYRGIYSDGKHQRLSPVYKDVFVHDYSRKYGAALRQLSGLFMNQEISLWTIRGNEHKDDVINYHDGCPYKKGEQYIIVVMALGQCPGLDLGKAQGKAYLSPPTIDYNTVIIKDLMPTSEEVLSGIDVNESQRMIGLLGHEIGHNMNIDHHGDGEGYRFVKSIESWIACIQGEHSGSIDCFMKYNIADYYLDMKFVPKSSLMQFLVENKLKSFPLGEYGQQNHFCRDSQSSGICGDADHGKCLGQIKVKSY